MYYCCKEGIFYARNHDPKSDKDILYVYIFIIFPK